MKRNLETIREILKRLHAYEDTELSNDVSYHIDGLIDQGYVNAVQVLRDGRTFYYQGLRLTWEGHELLASISNETVWQSIKDKLSERDLTVDDVPVAVVRQLSHNIMLSMFGGSNAWK